MKLTVSLLILLVPLLVKCHITGDKTYLSELKKLCEHAYMCFHDTVIVCGKSVNEARTFLDLCDLYEYSCEYNMGTLKKMKEYVRIPRNWAQELDKRISKYNNNDNIANTMCILFAKELPRKSYVFYTVFPKA